MAVLAIERPQIGKGLKDAHNALLAILTPVLCISSQWKIAEIQYLEFLFAGDLILLVGWFLANPSPLFVYRPLLRIGIRWTVVSFFAVLLALYGLNQTFYAGSVSILKEPFIVTLSRIGELFLDVFYMLFLASIYREDEWLCRLAAKTYLFIGVYGALFSIVSAIVLPLGIYLGGVYDGYRFRGLNNEGGSYGTYLFTVLFMILAMKKQGWLRSRTATFCIVVVAICLVGSLSKAAFFVGVMFLLLTPALRLRGMRLVKTLAVMTVLVITVSVAVDIPGRISIYTRALDEYRAVSLTRPTDGNYVLGRVSGIFLAPAMIAERPWTGIGFGNYPIIRDDPQYRRGTPIVATNLDSPSLGPIDYVVDFGIPLFLYFTWTELAPALQLIKRRSNIWLINLVLMQPVANWFGAHLNLTYPWIAASIALGMAYLKSPDEDSANTTTTGLVDGAGVPA